MPQINVKRKYDVFLINIAVGIIINMIQNKNK